MRLICPIASLTLLMLSASLGREPEPHGIDRDAPRTVDVPTSPVDATPFLRSALASGRPLHLPVGDYRVTDTLTLAPGQRIEGDGVSSTRLLIGPDFNAAAPAIVTVAPGDASGIDGIGFSFDQRGAQDRATIRRYPWALDIRSATRFGIGRLRISGAWNGINAAGNAGGLDAGTVEIGAFNVGLAMDGLLDFAHVTTLHCWPFEIAQAPKLMAVYADGGSTCADIGRVDGLDVKSLDTFASSVVFNARGGDGAARQIGQIQLDGDGALLRVEAGDVQIGALSSTKGAVRAVPVIEWRGRVGLIGSLRLWGGNLGPSLVVADGTLNVSGGSVENVADTTAIDVRGGTLMLANTLLAPLPNQIRTTPFVRQSGGALHAVGNRAPGPSTGGGILVAITADRPDTYVAFNAFNGWGFAKPAGKLRGTYAPN